MANRGIIKEAVAESPNRRSFVRKLGLASAVVGAAAKSKLARADTAPAVTDVDILTFALNLEYLEAEFYTVATSGVTIDQFGIDISGSGNLGVTMGWNQVAFSTTDDTVKRVATEIANDERKHVVLLRGAIGAMGGAPIAKPSINLSAFGPAFASEAHFLALARGFEDIGVTAYGGAAPLIQSKAILGYAARILATEAEHAGNVRGLCDRYGVATSILDGADELPPPSGLKFFSVDSNGITQTRTPGEVLFVAYGAVANATSGAFFPQGVNGNLNTSSAAQAESDGDALSASPNPITPGPGGYGQTNISWSANSAQSIEIHVNTIDGPVFFAGGPTGTAQTGQWVTDGMMFFLQDVTGGKALTSANTLATLIVHFVVR